MPSKNRPVEPRKGEKESPAQSLSKRNGQSPASRKKPLKKTTKENESLSERLLNESSDAASVKHKSFQLMTKKNNSNATTLTSVGISVADIPGFNQNLKGGDSQDERKLTKKNKATEKKTPKKKSTQKSADVSTPVTPRPTQGNLRSKRSKSKAQNVPRKNSTGDQAVGNHRKHSEEDSVSESSAPLHLNDFTANLSMNPPSPVEHNQATIAANKSAYKNERKKPEVKVPPEIKRLRRVTILHFLSEIFKRDLSLNFKFEPRDYRTVTESNDEVPDDIKRKFQITQTLLNQCVQNREPNPMENMGLNIAESLEEVNWGDAKSIVTWIYDNGIRWAVRVIDYYKPKPWIKPAPKPWDQVQAKNVVLGGAYSLPAYQVSPDPKMLPKPSFSRGLRAKSIDQEELIP